MGVTCAFKSASDEQLALLRREPKWLDLFFEPEDEPPPASWWSRLLRRPAAPPEALLAQTECMATDLDKAWHGLHFLFTGTAEGGDLPAAFLYLGGEEIGPFGARLVSAAEARRIKDFVHSLSEDELRSRFDPARMDELKIYPEGIWRRDGDDGLDYLLGNFETLSAFLRDVTDEGQGFVMEIS
jgi:hypothetical protein